jgi:GNAT superfamily N-acetyltransferase
LLVDGFQWSPRLMMNHNPAYYESLLVSWGLEKTKDLYAWWFECRNPDIQRWGRRVERLREQSRITIRAMRRRDFVAELARCKKLYHECWKDNWGYAPMSDEESAEMGRELRQFAKAELMLMAECDGQPVGFSMTLPDLNEAVRPLNGRLTKFGLPLGLIRLKSNLKRIKTARLIALGVLPHYRRRGIAEMMILRTFECGGQNLGYTGAELSWTLEDNALINRTIEAVGGRRYKTYRIYERSLV